nr:unnamed protein product [Spirometra erinaceieuropaei]
MDTETEVAGPNSRHRRTRATGNPQHQRHAETAEATLERPPKRLFYEDRFTPTRKSIQALQGYSENLLEAFASQPGQLGRPRPGPTYVEDSEDRHSTTAAKAKRKKTNLNCRRRLATPTSSRFQRANDINGHSGRQMDLLDTSGPAAPPELRQPSSLSLSPSTNTDRPTQPPPPPSSSLTSAAVASVMPINTTDKPYTQTPPPSTPVVRTWSTPVLIAAAPSPHKSVWSVACESIA